ncbi:glycosyltransferase [Nostoc sp. C110]|uniref:glycosyltransferase n=1 Tax=Nostoc sp. C110 TaxID=3349876 RepID=UPI00370D8C04
MTHFGILCPATDGHLNPMIALGRELQRRGNCVTLLAVADVESKILAAGLDYCYITKSRSPQDANIHSLAELGELSGFTAFKYILNLMKEEVHLLLSEAPQALKNAGVEALLVDQTTIGGETIAEYLQIPFVTVCNALPVNQEDTIPPFFTPWSYNTAWWACLRNKAAYLLMKRLTQPITQVLDEYRRSWDLPLYRDTPQKDSFSRLAQLSQLPVEFEFPRKDLPKCFHFTGPYQDISGREPIPFPYEKLTEQPLIYASLGTLQNRQHYIFRCIAEACADLDVQLVISLGGSNCSELLQKMPGSLLVVNYAPQLELLKKATITITHAGLNTVLESLSNSVPMLAIPIANDQLGIAARLVWTGVGEVVQLSQLSIPRLRSTIQKLMTEDVYKKNASKLQIAINRAGGVIRAADIVEQAVNMRKPVLSVTKE